MRAIRFAAAPIALALSAGSVLAGASLPPTKTYNFTPPNGLSVVGSTGAAPQGSNSTGFITQSAATTFRVKIHAFNEATNIVLGYWQSVSQGTGGTSLNGPLGTAQGTPVPMEASLEALSPSGPLVTDQPRYPVKLNNNISWSSDSNELLFTDRTALRMKAGDTWFNRVLLNTTSNVAQVTISIAGAGTDGRPVTGEGVATTGGFVYDSAGSTANTNQSLSFGTYAPLIVLGTAPDGKIAPSVALETDSIGAGTGDGLSPNTFGGMYIPGFAARAAAAAGVPWVSTGVGGTKLSDWAGLNHVYQRDELISYAPGVIIELGTNDQGSSTAAMQSNMVAIAQRNMQRYQNVLVCTLLPKTQSTDDWYTLANQSPLTSNDIEFQRRNFNRWILDNTGISAISSEAPQGLVNSSNTSFWTQYGFSGTPTVTVNGSAQTVTVVDAAGGNFTITAPATGATVLASYTKIQGLGPQLTAVAPLGAAQWKTWDIAASVEVDSSGAAISRVGYNPALTSAGYWPAAVGGTLYTGSITTGGNLVDSNQTSPLNTYANDVLKMTSGTTSGQRNLVLVQNNSGSPTYISVGFPNTTIGDTYKIYKPYTLDGTHPTPISHAQVAASAGSLIGWVSTPN